MTATPATAVAPRPHIQPVCISCGNRRLFLVNAPHTILRLDPDDVTHLPSLQPVICGRCGAHHAVILEYGD